MLLNREYIPMLVTGDAETTYCGGHEVCRYVKDNHHPKIINELIFACEVGDTKHVLLESLLPFFEMAEDEFYWNFDHVYTVDKEHPSVLGTPEHPILGLYCRNDVLSIDKEIDVFKARANVYARLVRHMDHDEIRYLDDITTYVRHLRTLRSSSATVFNTDYLLTPFTVITPWRTVEDVYVPFNLQQFQINNTDDDNELLTVRYTVHEQYQDDNHQFIVVRSGALVPISDLILSFTDLCTNFEKGNILPMFYVVRKSSKARTSYVTHTMKHWFKNPIPLTEIEPEE